MRARVASRKGAAVALLLLAAVAIAACTSGSSSPSSGGPTIFTPSPLSTATARAPATLTTSPTGPTSRSASPARHQATAPTAHAPVTSIPTGAPETGGGGTAGLQYGLLFGIGGAAMLAGLGSLAYRRRLTRSRLPRRPAAGSGRRRTRDLRPYIPGGGIVG